MKGHAISFRQDVAGFVRVLPRAPDQLGIVMIRSAARGAQLPANKQKILRALSWLKQNHPDYSDIEISQPRLDMYPEEGDELRGVEGLLTMDEDALSLIHI